MTRSERLARRIAGTACWLGVLILVALPFPGAAQSIQGAQPGIWQRFNNAIYEAAVYKRNRVRTLRPLAFVKDPATDKFVTQVSVLSSFDYSIIGVGNKARLPSSLFLFVSTPNELRQRCGGVRPNQLTMFLRMLVGLQPDTSFVNLAVLEVAREDIFRPSPYPQTNTTLPCASSTDSDCGNHFPPDPVINDYDPPEVKAEKEAQIDANLHHKAWMGTSTLERYIIMPFNTTPTLHPRGFPFTRLGYTYNWNPTASDVYGVSEYVVRPGSEYKVLAIFKPAEGFCMGAG